MPNDLLGSVRRTLRILDYLAQTVANASPREIAIETNSNISTVYHVLNTLAVDGYAKRDEATGRYSLGRKVASLGHAFVKRLSPPPQVRDVLRTLSEETGAHVYLTTLTGGDLIVADIVRREHSPPEAPYLGYSENFHALAMGKATLAYCPQSFIRAYFAAEPPVALTKQTLKNLDAIEAELERVRAQGFAESIREFNEETCAVGAPVFDGRGGVYGAIAVCSPSVRYDAIRRDARQAVIEAASIATHALVEEKRLCG
jgi:DNA-binding IclR family transcriptional regulator